MKIQHFSGGGVDPRYGRPYLRSEDIDEGMGATIDDEAYEQSAQESGFDKPVLRLPLKLLTKDVEGPDGRTTKVVWTPGGFASTYLVEHLGEDTTEWIDTKGSFQNMSIQTRKFGRKTAMHFLPVIVPNVGKVTEEGTIETFYACTACWAQFKTKDELQQHRETNHPFKEKKKETSKYVLPPNNQYVCDQCGKGAVSLTALKLHVKSEHS